MLLHSGDPLAGYNDKNSLFNQLVQTEKEKAEALERVATLERELLEVQQEKELLIKILKQYK